MDSTWNNGIPTVETGPTRGEIVSKNYSFENNISSSGSSSVSNTSSSNHSNINTNINLHHSTHLSSNLVIEIGTDKCQSVNPKNYHERNGCDTIPGDVKSQGIIYIIGSAYK